MHASRHVFPTATPSVDFSFSLSIPCRCMPMGRNPAFSLRLWFLDVLTPGLIDLDTFDPWAKCLETEFEANPSDEQSRRDVGETLHPIKTHRLPASPCSHRRTPPRGMPQLRFARDARQRQGVRESGLQRQPLVYRASRCARSNSQQRCADRVPGDDACQRSPGRVGVGSSSLAAWTRCRKAECEGKWLDDERQANRSESRKPRTGSRGGPSRPSEPSNCAARTRGGQPECEGKWLADEYRANRGELCESRTGSQCGPSWR